MRDDAPPAIHLRKLKLAEALDRLEAQLRAFAGQGRREVLVIHGKGQGSAGRDFGSGPGSAELVRSEPRAGIFLERGAPALGRNRRHRGGAPNMTETENMTIDQIVEPLAQRLGERGFLAGTAALVTGGARRIGRTLCLALAREGATVVVHYRNSESDAAATVLELEAFGGDAYMVQGDLSDPAVAIRGDRRGRRSGRSAPGYPGQQRLGFCPGQPGSAPRSSNGT